MFLKLILPRLCLSAIILSLASCAMFHESEELTVESSDEQYLALKEQLEQQKIEWQTQKPALERLVKNEQDLAFLIDALSKLSVIGTAPSLEQYLHGQPQSEQPINQQGGGSKNGSVPAPNEAKLHTTASDNPLATLADSPEELSALMNELQKLAQTARYNAIDSTSPSQSSPSVPQAYSHSGLLAKSKVQLSDYAGQLAGDLAKYSAIQGARIGVASFVQFDQSLRNTNSLGNQFAEALATELPQYGVTVVDFKLTQYIDVTPRGDLALSRDMHELAAQVDMKYVLTGTLVATKRGIKINSRVVSTSDNSVIAAASTFVPKALLQQIQP